MNPRKLTIITYEDGYGALTRRAPSAAVLDKEIGVLGKGQQRWFNQIFVPPCRGTKFADEGGFFRQDKRLIRSGWLLHRMRPGAAAACDERMGRRNGNGIIVAGYAHADFFSILLKNSRA